MQKQAIVYKASGKIVAVKNLGWLIAAIGKRDIYAQSVDVRAVSAGNSNQGIMQVLLSNGDLFQCEWADLGVCRNWLATRRNLRGVDLYWVNHMTKCDADSTLLKKGG